MSFVGVWVSPSLGFVVAELAFPFALHDSILLQALVDTVPVDAAILASALEASFASF